MRGAPPRASAPVSVEALCVGGGVRGGFAGWKGGVERLVRVKGLWIHQQYEVNYIRINFCDFPSLRLRHQSARGNRKS